MLPCVNNVAVRHPLKIYGLGFPENYALTVYRKVASSTLSQLVAHFHIFRLFMKGKFDAYVLWHMAQRVQNWIVDQSTARDFTVPSVGYPVCSIIDGPRGTLHFFSLPVWWFLQHIVHWDNSPNTHYTNAEKNITEPWKVVKWRNFIFLMYLTFLRKCLCWWPSFFISFIWLIFYILRYLIFLVYLTVGAGGKF